MTRVDFYQIESQEPPLLFACRLIDKIYHQRHQIHVHAVNQQHAEELDDLLWNFRPERFIPHTLVETETPAPIKIGHNVEPNEHQDVLVNLTTTVPHFFSHFARVTEVVPLNANSRATARQNYKFYQDRGYPLKYHKISVAKK